MTTKQQEALDLTYMSMARMTYVRAAGILGISRDSLKSRLRTATNKFKIEFPEQGGITPKKLARKKLKGATTHNGLWRYESAAMRAPLTKIDIRTGLRLTEAAFQKMPTPKKIDWKMKAHIKAKIIENTPMPFIHDIEYFDGIKPTIMSFGSSENNKKTRRPKE